MANTPYQNKTQNTKTIAHSQLQIQKIKTEQERGETSNDRRAQVSQLIGYPLFFTKYSQNGAYTSDRGSTHGAYTLDRGNTQL